MSSCDPMGSFNVFDDFFLWEILHIFRDFISQHHFCAIPFFSGCYFLMFLKTSVFLRLLFLRSSTSICNWWIVIAWLLTVSFSLANLNFKPITSQFSCALVLASWTVVLTAFSFRWMSFVTLWVSLLMMLVLCQAHWI